MKNESGDITNKLLIGGVVVIGAFFLNKMLKDSNARNAESSIDNSPEASQADTMYQMLHPYGGGLLSWSENVDEKKIIAYAKSIKNIDKVVQYYSALSKGSSMYDDLRTSLSEDEYAQFKANLQGSVSAPKSPVKKVVATPTSSNKILQLWNDFEFKSGLATVKPGVILGTTLKAVKYVSKAANLKGTEIKMFYVQGIGAYAGKKFYVLQSQVTLK